MKVIIAGSRNITDKDYVYEAIKWSQFAIDEVVCGEARGVDTIGKEWAEENGLPVASFPAEWSKYGKPAGPIRNAQMAKYADALILIWNPDKSKGSASMLHEASKRGMPIFERRGKNSCVRHVHVDGFDHVICYNPYTKIEAKVVK